MHQNFHTACISCLAVFVDSLLAVCDPDTEIFDNMPKLTTRTYPAGTIQRQEKHLYTAVGFAWMAWNSNHG